MIRTIGVGDNVVDRYIHSNMMYPGGNSINFSVYSRQMGAESAYMGVLADDPEGRLIVSALDRLGIDYSKCEFVHGETGRCSTHLVNGDRIITDDNDFGAVKTSPLELTKERLGYISRFDVAHSSCYSFIEGSLHKIKEKGVPVVYDFSDGWDEASLASVCPDISIAFLSGKACPRDVLEEVLKTAAGFGCEMAIATIGKAGAIVFDGNEFHFKEPYNLKAKVTDTLGAGDSFLTGFIVTYFSGLKTYRTLVRNNAGKYTTRSDRDEYMFHLIEHSMSVGNLLAINNCMVSGAFGMGAPLSR